ncbi:glycosyltransferase family protein [Woodsholea maritima]|uniref:hypothetical protein n=1 Tax=Woodsholea maritima TaxID=240237 RepID=UPI000373FD7B|nr:hypothetical protein [Woodsholea maritima]
MSVVAFVFMRLDWPDQARVLSQLVAGESVLALCLKRAARIKDVDLVVSLLPQAHLYDELAEISGDCGAMVVRGPGEDLLGLFLKAARESEAEHILAIEATSPFLDPGLCRHVLKLYRESAVDYATNDMPAGFPDGLSCHAFSREILAYADRQVRTPSARAHPIDWLRTYPPLQKANLTGPGGGLERLRWRVVFDEDVTFARAVYEAMNHRGYGEKRTPWDLSAAELAGLCLRRPDLVHINQAWINEARLANRLCADINSAPVQFMHAA